jgi:hypothetical protein
MLMLLLALNPLVAARPSQSLQDKAGDVIPQARPVYAWLKAVREADQQQLGTVFSQAMRKRFDEEGWDNVLRTYQEVFKKTFGEYRLEDFAFEYTGGQEEGRVSVVHRGQKFPGLRVIKEANEWKVNER